MKLVKSILIVAMVVISSATFAQKFGVLSVQEVMMKMPEVEEDKKKLEEIQASLVADMEVIQKEYQTKFQEYQKNLNTYSATMREQKEKDLQSLANRMQEFEQVASQELQEQQQLLYAPVQQKLTDAITKVGKDNGFTFIFNKQMPLYVSETEVADVTSLVEAALGIKK